MTENVKKRAGKPTRKAGQVRIQWVRSIIHAPLKHKQVVRGLGFTRLNQIVEREDTDAIRGMVNKVPHLLRILEEDAATAAK